MSIPNTDYENSYTTDGVTTAYDYTFPLAGTTDADAAQVNVYLNTVLQSTGTYTNTPNLTTAGGVITFNTAPTSGQTLLIQRDYNYLQTVTLQNNAPLPPPVIVSAIDKITILAQQLLALIGFAPTVSTTTPNFSGALGNPTEGSLIAVNPTNTGFEQVIPVQAGNAVIDGGPGVGFSSGPVTSAAGGNIVAPTGGIVVGNLVSSAASNGKTLADSGTNVATLQADIAAIVTNTVNGRAYLVSGSPYADGSSSGNSTIYYGPLPTGNKVVVDNGSGVLSRVTLAELSISLGTDAATYPWSLYLVNTSGTLTLEKDTWAGANTPPTYGSDALGRATKPGATNKLLVAEYALSATGTVNDWTGERGICNTYNHIRRSLQANISTSSWSYNSTTIRASDANSAYGAGRVGAFVGSVTPGVIDVTFIQSCANLGGSASNGIGVDSTTAYSNTVAYCALSNGAANTNTVRYVSEGLTIGFHYFQMLEQTSVSTTFYGSTTSAQSTGLSAINGLQGSTEQ